MSKRQRDEPIQDVCARAARQLLPDEPQSTWPYWRHADGRRAVLRETTPHDHWTVRGLNADPEPDVFMGLALALDALTHAGFTPAPIEQLTLDGSAPERIRMMETPKAQLNLF